MKKLYSASIGFMTVRMSIVLMLALVSSEAAAHEYWFEPETFFALPQQKVAVRLYVGDGLVKDREERPFQLAKTPMFRLLSTSDAWDLKTSVIDGSMPIYSFSADRAGNYLLAMERNWSYINLEPQKFEDYLREDGLEYVVAERAKLNEGTKEGRERYSRFIKSLLQVGERQDETYKKSVGLRLEIIPLENPYSKRAGDRLRLRVLFEGKPLAGKSVFADNRDSTTQRMTTDRRGEVEIRVNRKGLWLVRLVFMQRCVANCAEADWESFWGAFSFGVK